MCLALVVLILMTTGISAAEPFAVVELFTSEGCSSCPPADAVLNELARQPHVFALAFHVDYWNYLGWPDPFSNAKYTDRQRTYSRDIYTPQMIVNGTEIFVGSDRSRAQRVIAAALKRRAAVNLHLTWRNGAVDYEVTGASPEDVLQLALVESGLVQKVPRGENAGRTLRHDNVVRAFVSVSLDKNATGSAKLPAPTGNNSAIIGFVQQPASKAVLAATSVDIDGKTQ